MYTIKQIADLAGVTTRTLRHYDDLGLLKPEQTGVNGYRYYGDDSLLRLQQILFYRQTGLPLEKIKQIVSGRDFNALAALENHRQMLGQQARRIQALLQTVEDTILFIKGKKDMSKKALFEAFSEEQQEEYARQAEQRYDPEIVRASNARWKKYSPEEKEQILAEASQIYTELAEAMELGAGSEPVQLLVERWRKNMDHFWTPSLEQLQGLALLYSADLRFKDNFDKIHPRLAEFMAEAVRIYVEKETGGGG